jgi:hypothetical protein
LRLLKSILPALLLAAAFGTANYYLRLNPLDTSPLTLGGAPERGPASVTGEFVLPDIPLVHSKTRPLFSPSRRKWTAPVQAELPPQTVDLPVASPVPPPEPAAVRPEPPKIRLLGIQETPTGATALLLAEGSAAAVWHKGADVVENWTVRSIKPDSVELALDGATVKIELYPAFNASEPANGQ